jgi:hypothetical protein
MNSIGVKLPGSHAWHKHVPIMIGTIGHRVDIDYTGGPSVVLPVKK